MAEIPPQAVQAAAEALAREWLETQVHSDQTLARKVLEAAAPLIAEHIARQIERQKVTCPEHPVPSLPRPSCWTCGRNGMVHRLARIAGEAFPKGDDHDA